MQENNLQTWLTKHLSKSVWNTRVADFTCSLLTMTCKNENVIFDFCVQSAKSQSKALPLRQAYAFRYTHFNKAKIK